MIASVFAGSEVGIGTIIGSNIFNVLGILGVIALITPITMHRRWAHRDIPINILAILVATAAAFLPLLGSRSFPGVTQSEGIVIFFLFLAWLWMMVRRVPDPDDTPSDAKTFTVLISVSMVLAGIVGVFFGGRWVVSGALLLADLLGVSGGVIGLTIVGIGTSIPEFAVSVTAALRGRGAIAVGNIIGSNIFDFLGIIGLVSLVHAIPVPPAMFIDALVAVLALFVMVLLLHIGRPHVIERRYGFVLVALYFTYLASVLVWCARYTCPS